MKKFNQILLLISAAVSYGCGYLEPLDTERIYSEENLGDYPSFVRGFLETAFNKLPNDYESIEYAWLDAMCGDLLISSESHLCRRFSTASVSPNEGIFDSYWKRDYSAMLYLNKFLKDDLGYRTRYLTDAEKNATLAAHLKGDAFALRAWYGYDLLLKFSGRSASDGKLLGYPIMTDIVDYATVSADSFRRNSFDECVAQILSDCDSALVYLPEANRDYLTEDHQYEGAVRWRRPDATIVNSIKALTCLMWASPSFNPDGDRERWRMAAEAAAKVIDFKLTNDLPHGFNPKAEVNWFSQQSPEAIWCNAARVTRTEVNMYPGGFSGTGFAGPTQNIVDAFPMENGYPISREESGYDPENPYIGRDRRFYRYINYDGASVIRPSNGEVMYTFECFEGGKDEPGRIRNTKTGYYVRKFIHQGWNAYDDKVETQAKALMLIRFREICLVFAEAANHAAGSPLTKIAGYSAKEMLSLVRGLDADPYLDECSSSEESFDALVRNERRIELFMEGKRFHDIRRWGDEELDIDVFRASIVRDGEGEKSYSRERVETLSYPSLWLPLPRNEVRKASLEQNEGWEDWK